jgi:DNA mismatch repair protein MutS
MLNNSFLMDCVNKAGLGEALNGKLGGNNGLLPKVKTPEEKPENELDTEDRMHLINKKIDDNFIKDKFENLIEKKKYIKKDNLVSVNDYVYNDVEFLEDHYKNGDKGLFSKLDNCKTKMGSLLLKNIFLKPVHDVKLLQERQNIVQKISNVKSELIPLIDEIKVLENDLIWFWNDANLKHIELMNDLIYFNYDFIPFFNMNETLNNNEKALLITNIYKIIISPLLTILTPILSLLIPLILLFYFQRKSPIQIPTGQIISQYFKTLLGSDSMKIIFKNPTKAALASYATKGIYLFMYFQNIYYSVQSSSNTNKIINIIHDKLNKMARYKKLVNKMREICESSNNININIEPFINYNKIEDDLSIYDAYFNFPVFDKTPGIFTNKGKILYIFKQFKMNKDGMTNIFHYSGIIDAILSINHTLSNSNLENPFCLTKYLNSEKNSEKNKILPKILMKKIWHPYLDQKTVQTIVKNDIDINNNILITGPNAGGKSTFIKSVILNIILSQTIGISSAESFQLTPFKMIETYLHIPDSKGSSSLFEAEMLRSKEYIEKIKNLDSSDFSFIVLDEIFSSTNYIEGFSGAYSILKKIASFNNTMSITTTHYTDLEILEKDTSGKIVNYKFEVDYDANKEIIFNYKLVKGVSRQYIALDLLKKNGFDDDLIEDAINMCKKIKDKNLVFFNDEHEKDNKKEKKEKKIKKVKKVKILNN